MIPSPGADILEGFIASVWISLIVTGLSAVICLPAAYAFARMQFPRTNLPAAVLSGHQCISPVWSLHHNCRNFLPSAPDRDRAGSGPDPTGKHAAVHDLDSDRRLSGSGSRPGGSRTGCRGIPAARVSAGYAAPGGPRLGCRTPVNLHRYVPTKPRERCW